VEDENLSPATVSAGSCCGLCGLCLLCVCFEGTKETQQWLGLRPGGFHSKTNRKKRKKKEAAGEEEVRMPQVRHEENRKESKNEKERMKKKKSRTLPKSTTSTSAFLAKAKPHSPPMDPAPHTIHLEATDTLISSEGGGAQKEKVKKRWKKKGTNLHHFFFLFFCFSFFIFFLLLIIFVSSKLESWKWKKAQWNLRLLCLVAMKECSLWFQLWPRGPWWRWRTYRGQPPSSNSRTSSLSVERSSSSSSQIRQWHPFFFFSLSLFFHELWKLAGLISFLSLFLFVWRGELQSALIEFERESAASTALLLSNGQ